MHFFKIKIILSKNFLNSDKFKTLKPVYKKCRDVHSTFVQMSFKTFVQIIYFVQDTITL